VSEVARVATSEMYSVKFNIVGAHPVFSIFERGRRSDSTRIYEVIKLVAVPIGSF
jgi:hypothetical protein